MKKQKVKSIYIKSRDIAALLSSLTFILSAFIFTQIV